MSIADDSDLPALSTSIDTGFVADLLVGLGRCDGSAVEVAAGIDVEVLRHRPNRRCTLRYRVSRPDGTSRTFVAKLYHSEARAQSAFAAQSGLFRQQRAPGLRIPEPVALVERLAMVLMEDMAGTPMRDQMVDATDLEVGTCVVAAADVLRELHTFERAGERRSSLEVEAAAVSERLERLRAVAPEIACRSADLVGSIRRGVTRAPCGPLGTIHGDYTPSQLILDAGFPSPALVDFDRVGFGEPAVDIGTFMSKLVRDAVSWDRPHLVTVADEFMDHYGLVDPGARRRARLIQALSLVRICASRVLAGPGSSGADPMRYLEEADTCLAKCS